MHLTVNFIKIHKPLSFLLENVVGISVVVPGERQSALELIMNELRSAGYSVTHTKVDSSPRVEMSRPRTDARRG